MLIDRDFPILHSSFHRNSQEASLLCYKCEPLAFITRQPHYQDIHNYRTEHAFFLAVLLSVSFTIHTNSPPSARQGLFFLRVIWKHPRHLPGLQMVLLNHSVESSLTTQRISGRWKGMTELRSYWRCARQSELTVVIVCNFFCCCHCQTVQEVRFCLYQVSCLLWRGEEPPNGRMEGRNSDPTLKLLPRNLSVVRR